MSALRNIVFGVLFTLLLLVFLSVTRLIFLKVDPAQMELTKIEMITLTPPPEPQPVQPNQKSEVTEMAAPPTPPSLAELRPSIDLASFTMPNLQQSVPLDLSVDLFSLEVQPQRQHVATPKQKQTPRPVRVLRPLAKLTGGIGISDLDANPSVVRRGRFRWPSRVRSELVKAVVKVELNERGNVKLIEIKSVSDESIRSVLPAIVNGSKFTVPKKNGKPVKVVFNWPLILKKP
ncbi:hypothetical protein [Rubritalea profundi]|uniref:TonB C-terminal domain-containing protein n=1 Tax=Rubritalea profundi TaxID=1658618 RepID=A0A2S7U4C0_9BACT|nr:hypothetical protein [Rubritalea profundi]PQJ29865.1 hypothetical protein BSZ32_16160 [Rubritalea profundi]